MTPTPPVPEIAAAYAVIAGALDNAVRNGCVEELSKMSVEDIAYDLARFDSVCERLPIETLKAGVRAWLSPQDKHKERPCENGKHYWPTDYDSGDTCQCGAFYLTSLPDGTMEIEETES